MGSIEENRYRCSIDTLVKVSIVSILGYPSKNPHHELHIHKLVKYFEVFRLSDFEFFRFLRHLPHFWVFPLKIFFYGSFNHYSIDNTKYQYSTIPKGIDTLSIVSILFHFAPLLYKLSPNVFKILITFF